ncbi:MAG: hypothetical protein JXR94_09070, partial [Candidatus Hydrogenedentes bacterium]|nr:hypothetical protein [Candidatus Hydrogenedentota bacterium]
YLFTEDELAAVEMPSMLMFGEREKSQTRGAATMGALTEKIYGALSPPKCLLEIRRAHHFSFSSALTDGWAGWFLSGTDAQYAVIRRYAVAFLERHVALQQPGASPVLDARDPLLTRYLREPGPLE